MKRKNVFLVWLLTNVTSGLYLFHWILSSARQLNGILRKPVLNASRWANAFVVLAVAYLAGIIFTINTKIAWPAILLAITLVGFLFYTFTRVGKLIAEIEAERGIEPRCAPYTNAALLFIAAYGIVPMQAHLNRILPATGGEDVP